MPLGFVTECLRARIALFFAFVVLVAAVVVLLCPMGSFYEPWIVGVSSVRETSSSF